VYVGKLSDRTREQDLQDAFHKFGKIARINMKQGFGFVEFENKEDAEQAVKEMNGKQILGNEIIVESAQGGRQTKSQVFHTEWRVRIDHLSSRCNWRDLKELFSRDYVIFVDVLRDGTGIAEFERYEDMKRAIRGYDGMRFQGHSITVKEDRGGGGDRGRGGRSDRYKPYQNRRSRSKERRRSRSPRKTDNKDNGRVDRDDRRAREEKQDNREEEPEDKMMEDISKPQHHDGSPPRSRSLSR